MLFFATDSDRMSMTDLLPSAPHFYVESIILDHIIVLMIFDVCFQEFDRPVSVEKCGAFPSNGVTPHFWQSKVQVVQIMAEDLAAIVLSALLKPS